MREHIKHFVPCNCSTGGLLVNGIEMEHKEQTAYVHLFCVHTYGHGPKPGIWQRMKDAWDVLFRRDIRYDDAVLDHGGVQKLHEACQDALNRWPDDGYDIERVNTLHDLYREIVDEDVGRKIRTDPGLAKLYDLLDKEEDL